MTTKKTETEQKKCFIITPIGGDNSETRRKANGLIDAVILPVLKELNIDGQAAHHIELSGNITKQVIVRIVNDDLVIANLSELNPNVMYELAIRHAKRRPVIVLAEKGTDLPFDIAQERALFYVNDMIGVEDLKPRLKSAIEKALEEENPDNPIYNAIEDSIMREVAIKNSNDTERYILDKLEALDRKITNSNTQSFSKSIDTQPAYLLASISVDNYDLAKLVIKERGFEISGGLKLSDKSGTVRTKVVNSSDYHSLLQVLINNGVKVISSSASLE